MSELNKLSCLTDKSNTGVPSCVIDLKNIVGAIQTPKGFTATTETLALFKQALLDAANSASIGNRIFPIYDLRPSADNSEAPTIQTFATGQKAVVREGMLDWTFQFVAGGLSLLKKLRKYNKASTAHDFLFVDANNTIIGMEDKENDALKAIPSDGGFFWAHPWKANDGSNVTQYILQFVFQPKYINDFVGYVVCDFDVPTTIKGLIDIELSNPSANVTSGSYNIKAVLPDNGTDMGDEYESELETIGNWDVKNAATGATVPVSSVAYNSTTKILVVALNTADAAYPDIPGNILFSLAEPATLASNGLEGFVSNQISVPSNTTP